MSTPYDAPSNPAKRQSAAMTDGPDRAGARAMLKGAGFTDEDLAKPIVGVGTTWIETMPCNLNQRDLAVHVKQGVRDAGGTPMEFNTVAVSDGVSMGTPGMRASLVSREVVADSIELVSRGHLFDGLVCFDWETVLPLYRIHAKTPEVTAAWDAMLQEINSPNISRAFAPFVNWTIPEGVTAWTDLTTEQRDDFAATAHRKVGVDFFVRTVEGVRALRPRSKLHYYGLPQGIWPFYDAERSAHNDEMAAIWQAVDVLSPSLYQLYWTTNDPASSPCPEAVNTPARNALFFKALLDEMYRLKTAYPRTGQQIIPYAWWHYKAQAGSCSPDVNPTLLVNDTNLIHQLQLPWWYGADGVAIWGHFRRNVPVTPEVISADIQARWRAPMSRLGCPR